MTAMSWPDLEESWCPHCERVVPRPRRTRLHNDGAEFECPFCGRRPVRREGDGENVYFFFPGDVAAAVSADVRPLFDERDPSTPE
jgi:hypothetical protein